MVTKVDAQGNIKWLPVVPKYQYEVQRDNSEPFYSFGTDEYYKKAPYPQYSGIAPFRISDNKTVVVFNDNKKNQNVTDLDQPVSKIRYFSTSDLYALYIDDNTGAITRKSLHSNSGRPIPMPRKGLLYNDGFYFISNKSALLKNTFVVSKLSLGN